MMREDAAAYAADMLERHGLDGWRVTITRSVTALGVCRFRTRTIGLSGPLLDRNGLDVFADVIAHEVAHALAGPGAGHGPVWRERCAETGARPTACANAERDNIATVPARYRVICPTCGDLGGRNRLPRRGRIMGCSVCRSTVTYVRAAA